MLSWWVQIFFFLLMLLTFLRFHHWKAWKVHGWDGSGSAVRMTLVEGMRRFMLHRNRIRWSDIPAWPCPVWVGLVLEEHRSEDGHQHCVADVTCLVLMMKKVFCLKRSKPEVGSRNWIFRCHTSLESYDSCDSIDVNHFKIESQQQVQSTSLSDHELVNNVKLNSNYSPKRTQRKWLSWVHVASLVWIHQPFEIQPNFLFGGTAGNFDWLYRTNGLENLKTVPNLWLLQHPLEVKLHKLLWTSLERGHKPIYQVWCRCSKDLLRNDLASFLAIEASLLTLIGFTVQTVLKIKKPCDDFCEACSEDNLCQIYWRLVKLCRRCGKKKI